jgi:hypothetical protein
VFRGGANHLRSPLLSVTVNRCWAEDDLFSSKSRIVNSLPSVIPGPPVRVELHKLNSAGSTPAPGTCGLIVVWLSLRTILPIIGRNAKLQQLAHIVFAG